MARSEGLVFAAACAVYARSTAFGYVQDDFNLLVHNPLLRTWRHLHRLLLMGYWQPWAGDSSPVSIYRPVVSLSYFLQVQTLDAAWAFHAVNVLLHASTAALLAATLKRWLRPGAALLAGLLFAVHPVQAEAVVRVASRPDLLCALFLLASWGLLEDGRLAAGCAGFALALGSLESAAMFPAAYALFAQWRRGDLRAEARRHAALWAVLAAYLALRAWLLPGPLIKGGTDYFASTGTWVKLLTLSRFWFLHYLSPLAAGLGLFHDPMRPFFPDAAAADPFAILLLAGWAGLFAAAAAAAWRRSAWGFWTLFGGLFLLPTSHLLFRYDTLGAARFLYLPSVGFFVIAAAAAERFAARRGAFLAAAAAVTALACRTLAVQGAWRDNRTYWTAVLAENPRSSAAFDSIGVAQAVEGDAVGAEASFTRSIAADPTRPEGYYNLAKLRLARRGRGAARPGAAGKSQGPGNDRPAGRRGGAARPNGPGRPPLYGGRGGQAVGRRGPVQPGPAAMGTGRQAGRNRALAGVPLLLSRGPGRGGGPGPARPALSA